MLHRIKGKPLSGMCLDGAGWGQIISSQDIAGIIVTKSATSHTHSHRPDSDLPPAGVRFSIHGEDAVYDTARAMLDRVEVLLKEKGIEIIGDTFDATGPYIQNGKVVN